MMIEKDVLKHNINQFIEKGCKLASSEEENMYKFKAFLKKDPFNSFIIYDREFSINCIFDKQFLDDYLINQPSYVKLDDFDSSMILIKKCYFDVLMLKNVNDILLVKVVLYIKEFEVDVAQRSKERYFDRKNINTDQEVRARLEDFLYKYTQEYVQKNFYFKNLIDASNFIKKEFPVPHEEEAAKLNTSCKNKSLIKLIPHGLSNFLLNTNIAIDNDRVYLQATYNFSNDEMKEGSNPFDNINAENLKKLDLTKVFYKQPSQKALGRKQGDLSLSEKIDDSKIFSMTNFGKNASEMERDSLLLHKKTYRKGSADSEALKENLLKEMPESIKNLINNYSDTHFTVDIYEKYRLYKKYNSTFTKLNA